jgi:hypothetical protein
MKNLRFFLHVTVGEALLWFFLKQISPFTPQRILFVVVASYGVMLCSCSIGNLLIDVLRDK